MKTPRSAKMDLLAAQASGKSGKIGLLGSAPKESAPDFSGLLGGLMKSQLGAGNSAVTKVVASSEKPDAQKKSDKTRESRRTEVAEESAVETAAHEADRGTVAALLLPNLSSLPGAMWVVARAAKQSGNEPSGESQERATGSAPAVDTQSRDSRRALLGGDLALALATMAKSAKSGDRKSGDRESRPETQDASVLFDQAPAVTRSSSGHGVLDKSQAELTRQTHEPLTALSPRKESDAATEENKAKVKSAASTAPTAEGFRMELPKLTESSSPAQPTSATTDVRSDVLAPDPSAADLNIRGSVQGQSARLVVDAGQGLGELELHLRVRQGVASIRIEGESAALVASRTDELRRSVESQGLSLGTVEIARPTADRPISHASTMNGSGFTGSDRGDRSGGAHTERLETRLEEGTARGQPASLSSQRTSTRGADGSVDVQA